MFAWGETRLGWFSKIIGKGGSIHHLIHRAHHIKAPQLPGRNTGNVGSENREMSPREPQKEGKGDTPNKTVSITERGDLVSSRGVSSGWRFNNSDWKMGLCHCPSSQWRAWWGATRPGYPIIKYLSCQERRGGGGGCLPGNKTKQTTINNREALEDDKP